MYIIPTDDQKLKFVVTPYEAGKDFTAHIMSCLEGMSETDAQVETELLLPTFKVLCAH